MSGKWLRRDVKQFRGGLVFKAHRLVNHSTLDLRVIKKKKKSDPRIGDASRHRRTRSCRNRASAPIRSHPARETGVLSPNNQRQHRTSHAPKDVLHLRICANYLRACGRGGTSGLELRFGRSWGRVHGSRFMVRAQGTRLRGFRVHG